MIRGLDKRVHFRRRRRTKASRSRNEIKAAAASDPFARLIDDARKVCPEAWSALVEFCHTHLLAVARRGMPVALRGKLDAADLVQDTWIDAQRHLDHFHGRSQGELLAWLRHILMNNLRDVSRRYLRSAKRGSAVEISLNEIFDYQGRSYELPAIQPPPSAEYHNREQVARLAEAILNLPNDHRTVLELRHHEGLSFTQIAQRTQQTPNAARKLWVRAIERLRHMLAETRIPAYARK